METLEKRPSLLGCVALAVVLVLALGAGAAVAQAAAEAQPAYAAQAGKWRQSEGKWWYSYSGGGYAKSGWKSISGTWYLFDGEGWMLTGWQRVGGKWYYLSSSGAMQTSWKKLGGTWYYLNKSGDMAVGWKKVANVWYYLRDNGSMAIGWQKLGGKWYYLSSSGAMQAGWQKIGSQWYYFSANGQMAENSWVGDYYLGASGAMATSQWVGNYYVDGTGKWKRDMPLPTYTVLFVGGEGVVNDTYTYPNILKEEKVKRGGNATPPSTVKMEESYLFDGWDRSYTNVQEDIIVRTKALDEYVLWRAAWIKDNINSSMTDREKLEKLAAMFSDSFYYNEAHSSAKSLWHFGSGDCSSGNYMLMQFCEDMGIRCRAVPFPMLQRRYSQDFEFPYQTNHFNCLLYLDGVKYRADYTPDGPMFIKPFEPEKYNPVGESLIQGKTSLTNGPKDQEPDTVHANSYGSVYVIPGITKGKFTVSKSQKDSIIFEVYNCRINSITIDNSSVIRNSNTNNVNYDYAYHEYDTVIDMPPYSCDSLNLVGTGTATVTLKVTGTYGVDKGRQMVFTYTIESV